MAAEAEELALAGHDVHVICPGATRRHGDLTVHGCGGGSAFGWPGTVARLSARPWRAALAARFVARARRTLRAVNASEIRAHWMVPSAWPIAAGHRVHVTCHGGDVRLLCSMPAPLCHRIVRSVADRAHHIAFAARHLRVELLAALDDDLSASVAAVSSVKAPMLVVAIPDQRERQRARARLRDARDVPVFGIVGRLVEGKRVDLALRAVFALPVPARLVVIGDGPERGALEALARELGVDARFEGQRDRTQTHALIAATDGLIHTSAAEGAPSVVREARVLGVPVIATPSGDLPRWAERDRGIALVAATPEALSAALCNAIMRSRANDRSATMSAR